MNQSPGNGSTRREFLLRAIKATAAVAAASFIGYRFRTNRPTARTSDDAGTFSLPDFSIPNRPARMCVVTGADRTKTINLALDALGGMGEFVKNGDHVLIKVNAAFATPPILGATTHPQLLEDVIRLCYAAGAAAVAVTDNPINDAASCFELTGLAAAARSAGARVVIPRESSFRPCTVPGSTYLVNWPVLAEPFHGVTKLIGLAPLKDHQRSGASMTLKNWYGLLGGRRNVFHQDIHGIITDLAMMVKPTLVVLDGTQTMMTNGPTGGSLSDLKATNTMIVSTDPVAADAFGATLLGRTPADLPYILRAAAAGAGTANYDLLNPIMLKAGET